MSAYTPDVSDEFTRRELIEYQCDPDTPFDQQRWYTCDGCGWPCINPIGSLPEREGLCLDCTVQAERQTHVGEWSL